MLTHACEYPKKIINNKNFNTKKFMIAKILLLIQVMTMKNYKFRINVQAYIFSIFANNCHKIII